MEEVKVKQLERVVLIGLITNKQDKFKIEEYLDELEFLVDTAGGQSMERFIQRLNNPDPRFFVGSGKLEEIKEYIQAEDIETAVFDEELSPIQIRNIERQMNCKVLDRTNLILDIFAKRARTSHAKTQVELAQYEYLLPRLTRMWTHLSKQKGGIGMKGPGEKEIETDRRIIRDKINQLKQKLQQIDKQKATQRKNRGSMVRLALVGYTNVGKSTLMSRLGKTDVFAENKLFATLDTTVRKVVVGNLPFLLSDTVGFIRKLPHSLVESFKSTLDEVRESDIIVHIVDISHPDFEDHINVVHQTLNEIGVSEKRRMMVFNKIDVYKTQHATLSEPETEEMQEEPLEELGRTWMAKTIAPTVFISAKNKLNIDGLRDTLYEEVKKIHIQRYPYNNFLY